LYSTYCTLYSVRCTCTVLWNFVRYAVFHELYVLLFRELYVLFPCYVCPFLVCTSNICNTATGYKPNCS
jgi:hypothetical protein